MHTVAWLDGDDEGFFGQAIDSEALEDQLRGTFPVFSGGKAHITASSLAAGLMELGRPVDPLVAEVDHAHRPVHAAEVERSQDARVKLGRQTKCGAPAN